MPKEKSCGIIVYSKNKRKKYLLLHYPSGHWDLPKGHVEKDEEEEVTALRELAEETDITEVELDNGFRETINYYFREKGQTIYKEVVFFLGHTTTEKVKISFEHQNFEWLPYKQAHAKLTFQNAKGLLEKAEKFLEKSSSKK